MQDRRAWQTVGVAATALGVIAVWATGARKSWDFIIYRTITHHYRTTGELPRPDQMLGDIPGNYADFTPLNLRIYEVITRDPAWFVYYELAILLGGVVLLGCFWRRLGLSLRSLTAMCGAVVACSVTVLYGYEDKATFFTLALLAAICVDARPVVRGGALGLLFGWTGLGLFALPLAVLRGPKRDRISAAVAAVVVAAGCLAAAGSDARLLFTNRFDREAADPFWYSIWHFVGPLYSPTLRNAALVGVSAIILWRAWRRRITSAAAVVALCAVNLLASNNTDAVRIAMFLPLGVLMFAHDNHHVIWCAALIGWALVMRLDPAGNPHPSGWELGWVLVSNAPLIVIVAMGLRTQLNVTPYLVDAHDTNPAHPPSAVTSPL